jgi:mannitol operon repressor
MVDGRKVVHTVGHASKITPYLQPFADFLGDLNAESDRGAVLTAAAFIDDLLGKTIAAFLVEGAKVSELVEDYPGPLSSFSARILAAHALGLISDNERAECSAIRKVRNEFAHVVKMSFDNERVKSLCSSLKAAVGPQDGLKPNARMQFTTSAVAVIGNLYNRPHYVSQARLKFVDWKV